MHTKTTSIFHGTHLLTEQQAPREDEMNVRLGHGQATRLLVHLPTQPLVKQLPANCHHKSPEHLGIRTYSGGWGGVPNPTIVVVFAPLPW